jgi:protocatechuate 3,4-dioxygenase beta subunit
VAGRTRVAVHEEDLGLVYDIRTLVNRRAALGLFGGIAGAALLAACAADQPTSPSTANDGSLTEVPDETGGPFPGDGSNGINVLDDSGIVRTDIRSSFGTSTTTAEGVPLTIKLTVLDAASGNVLDGAAVYVWHCTADGAYSLYGESIFPGAYPGRWPHIHFEVYSDVDTAVASGPIVKTSQIALPQDASEAVYATSGYGPSANILAGSSLTADMVFSEDGGIHQLATMTGSVADGYTAALTIAV